MLSRNDNDVVVIVIVVAVVVFVLQAESGVILNTFTLCMTRSGEFCHSIIMRHSCGDFFGTLSPNVTFMNEERG
jgi:hypothetical protein